MDIPFASVNLTAVVVATVVNMILGMTWYNPKVFGEQWMKYTGMTQAKAEEGMKKGFALGLLSTFVLIYTLGLLLVMTGTGSLQDALTLGVVLWVGLNITGELSGVAWEQRPEGLMAINSGFMLVGILVPLTILVKMGV